MKQLITVNYLCGLDADNAQLQLLSQFGDWCNTYEVEGKGWQTDFYTGRLDHENFNVEGGWDDPHDHADHGDATVHVWENTPDAMMLVALAAEYWGYPTDDLNLETKYLSDDYGFMDWLGDNYEQPEDTSKPLYQVVKQEIYDVYYLVRADNAKAALQAVNDSEVDEVCKDFNRDYEVDANITEIEDAAVRHMDATERRFHRLEQTVEQSGILRDVDDEDTDELIDKLVTATFGYPFN